MWQRTYTNIYPGVTKNEIWQAWADVANWPKWDKALEYCQIDGEFVVGNQFILKPIGAPKVKLVLSEVSPNKSFTDYCKFLGATMHDAHELKDTAEGLSISNTITVVGLLSFLWVKLVAKNVAASAPEQMDRLVEYVRNKR